VTIGILAPDRTQRVRIMPPIGSPQGVYVNLAAEIKKAVNIPVIAVGRITKPRFADQVLADGKADMIGMARQLVADPEWQTKAGQGRFDDIVPCTGCNDCHERFFQGLVIRCSVNAAVGRERDFKIVPAKKPLTVAVVGGGPAGMEFARIAALRATKSHYMRKNAS